MIAETREMIRYKLSYGRYRRGSQKDSRLTDADLVHLGYSLDYKMDYFMTADKSLGHYVPSRSKLSLIDLNWSKGSFKD